MAATGLAEATPRGVLHICAPFPSMARKISPVDAASTAKKAGPFAPGAPEEPPLGEASLEKTWAKAFPGCGATENSRVPEGNSFPGSTVTWRVARNSFSEAVTVALPAATARKMKVPSPDTATTLGSLLATAAPWIVWPWSPNSATVCVCRDNIVVIGGVKKIAEGAGTGKAWEATLKLLEAGFPARSRACTTTRFVPLVNGTLQAKLAAVAKAAKPLQVTLAGSIPESPSPKEPLTFTVEDATV